MNIKDKLQAARAVAASWLPDVFMASGGAGVAYGASMVYLPAGWMVGGALAIAAGVLLARGAK